MSPDRDRLFDELRRLFFAADDAVARVREAFPSEVSCRQGCTDCCHAVFDISLVEAVYLYTEFETLVSRADRRLAARQARKALRDWEALLAGGAELARARVRCPLLTAQGRCLCYPARPVNCRTYGVPTAIHGRSHVCGLTGFVPGRSYPTLDLAPLQHELHRLSLQVGGVQGGGRRWPVAAVLLGHSAPHASW